MQYTATTALLTCPVVPVYWRPTPAVAVPFFSWPVSSKTSTAPGAAR
ncbi:hypothetical protein RB628_10620 [Streptomyces sp. ADMS]|nr:hypothetical protein [Streptomyces sp. ADMS]MDW4905777.1 hypothetical protein [Streptomyces sp. ADMS]